MMSWWIQQKVNQDIHYDYSIHRCFSIPDCWYSTRVFAESIISTAALYALESSVVTAAVAAAAAGAAEDDVAKGLSC